MTPCTHCTAAHTTAEHLMLAKLAYGFEPGRMCKPDQEAGEVDFGWSPDWKDVPQGHYPYCVMHMLPLPHEIPPPPVDTFDAMGRIIEALWKRGLRVFPFEGLRPPEMFRSDAIIVQDRNYRELAHVTINGLLRAPDAQIIAAVCEAALRVLRREEQP